jgi:hypothetical protein
MLAGKGVWLSVGEMYKRFICRAGEDFVNVADAEDEGGAHDDCHEAVRHDRPHYGFGLG